MRFHNHNSLSWRLFISYGLIIVLSLLGFLFITEWLEPVISQSTLEFNDGHLHLTADEIDLAATIHGLFKQSLRQAFGISFLLSLFLALLLSLLVIRQIVSPLKELKTMSNRIAQGEYSQRLAEVTIGEIRDLVVSFNAMANTLQKSDEQRILLMRNYAHEFRTPLSALQGTIQGISDGVYQADKGTLEICHRQLKRLLRLLEDLSLLSKVESNEITVKQEVFNLTNTLKESLQLMKQDYLDKGVDLNFTETVESLAWGDKQRTDQIMTNLLSNALRHTQPGGCVSIKIMRAANDFLRVEVSDNGEGIPKEAQALIFQRFYRVDSARSYSQKYGSGIGLTISQHLVRRQGGEIGLVSHPNEGSTFWFTLPAAKRVT